MRIAHNRIRKPLCVLRRAKRGKNSPARNQSMPEAESTASGIFYVVTTRRPKYRQGLGRQRSRIHLKYPLTLLPSCPMSNLYSRILRYNDFSDQMRLYALNQRNCRVCRNAPDQQTHRVLSDLPAYQWRRSGSTSLRTAPASFRQP